MPTTHPSAPSVRPLRAGEVGPLIEVFDRLSAQSRFLRFNAPLPRLTTLMVEQLTAQEEGRHAAFVASVDGMAVGIGRWVRYAAHPQRADVAVEVVDAYHRRGIGRALMQAVTESAALAGVEFLFFCVRRDNDPRESRWQELESSPTWTTRNSCGSRSRSCSPTCVRESRPTAPFLGQADWGRFGGHDPPLTRLRTGSVA